MSAQTTFVAKCADGFVRKVKSQLSAWTTSAAECTEGFGRKVLQLSAQLWVIEEICS